MAKTSEVVRFHVSDLILITYEMEEGEGKRK